MKNNEMSLCIDTMQIVYPCDKYPENMDTELMGLKNDRVLALNRVSSDKFPMSAKLMAADGRGPQRLSINGSLGKALRGNNYENHVISAEELYDFLNEYFDELSLKLDPRTGNIIRLDIGTVFNVPDIKEYLFDIKRADHTFSQAKISPHGVYFGNQNRGYTVYDKGQEQYVNREDKHINRKAYPNNLVREEVRIMKSTNLKVKKYGIVDIQTAMEEERMRRVYDEIKKRFKPVPSLDKSMYIGILENSGITGLIHTYGMAYLLENGGSPEIYRLIKNVESDKTRRHNQNRLWRKNVDEYNKMMTLIKKKE